MDKIVGGQLVQVDECDGHLLLTGKWVLAGGGYVVQSAGPYRRQYLHRIIMSPPAGLVVDHINGQKTDCRRENLRITTRARNLVNRPGASARSGRRGVHWVTEHKLWRVSQRADGKTLVVGYFKKLSDAIVAREAFEASRPDLFPPAGKENWSALSPEHRNIN